METKRKNLDAIWLRSVFVHDAFCSECWTFESAPWDKKDMITLGHNYTAGWAIHVRSAAGSSVNFWSGTGVIYQDKAGYLPSVLSFSQYESLKPRIHVEKVQVFEPSFGPNLQGIPVVN